MLLGEIGIRVHITKKIIIIFLKYFTTYYINRIKLLRIISTISDYSSMGQRDDGVKIDTVEP